jgi:hypothetical protein
MTARARGIRSPLALLAAMLAMAVLTSVNDCVADRCDYPDLIDTLPPDGARGVAPNAPLTALYNSLAEYLGEEVVLVTEDGEERVLDASFSAAEGILTATPSEPLDPNAAYEVLWPELRGIGTASKGRGADVEFSTGEAEDIERPDFAGLRSIEWNFRRERDECSDDIRERFVFDFELARARDDGGEESLLVLLFQTQGGDDDEPQQVLVQRYPTDRKLRVERAAADARGEVCFSALVRDLMGRVSTSGDAEVCATTTQPPFFEGCRVNRAKPSSTPAWWHLGLLAALAVRRRGVR